MKALVKYGEQYGNLELRDVPVPSAEGDDVVIKVKAAGICGSDLHAFRGTGVDDPAFAPSIYGHEFAGVVSEVGKNVTDWKVGDRVVSENTGYACGTCSSCIEGQFVQCADRGTLGYGMDGGFAEYVRIPGRILRIYPNGLFRIPQNVSFEEAAILDPYCNGYKAVVQEMGLLPGEDIVVFGAGPLALSCVHIAHIMGAGNVILVGTASNIDVRFPIAKKLGATHLVVADKENVVGRIREICGKDGLRCIAECSGAQVSLLRAIDTVRNGGIIAQVGMFKKEISVPMDTVALRAITIKGHMGYDTVSWRNCLSLLEKGILDAKSMITHRLPLSDWKKGFELMMSRAGCKVILTPEEA